MPSTPDEGGTAAETMIEGESMNENEPLELVRYIMCDNMWVELEAELTRLEYYAQTLPNDQTDVLALRAGLRVVRARMDVITLEELDLCLNGLSRMVGET